MQEIIEVLHQKRRMENKFVRNLILFQFRLTKWNQNQSDIRI